MVDGSGERTISFPNQDHRTQRTVGALRTRRKHKRILGVFSELRSQSLVLSLSAVCNDVRSTLEIQPFKDPSLSLKNFNSLLSCILLACKSLAPTLPTMQLDPKHSEILVCYVSSLEKLASSRDEVRLKKSGEPTSF